MASAGAIYCSVSGGLVAPVTSPHIADRILSLLVPIFMSGWRIYLAAIGPDVAGAASQMRVGSHEAPSYTLHRISGVRTWHDLDELHANYRRFGEDVSMSA